MTTKELIRAEIKRLKAENNCGTDEFIAAKDIAYDKVFDFLETLEEPVTDCHELTEAAEEYSKRVSDGHNYRDLICGFIAGAEWQKAKMMEGAVEGLICATITGTNAISFLSPLPKELTAGSEVRIIILPKEDAK